MLRRGCARVKGHAGCRRSNLRVEIAKCATSRRGRVADTWSCLDVRRIASSDLRITFGPDCGPISFNHGIPAAVSLATVTVCAYCSRPAFLAES